MIIYHGSDHIVKTPQYMGDKETMIMVMGFMQLNMRTGQKVGRY